MSLIGTIQISGNQNLGPAEVELNTHALRRVIRPGDYTYYGSYAAAAYTQVGTPTNGAAVGLASGLPTHSFWWEHTGSIAVIRKASYGAFRYGTVTSQGSLSLSIQRQINVMAAPLGALIANSVITMSSGVGIFPSPLRDNMADSGAYIIAAPTAANSCGIILSAGNNAASNDSALGWPNPSQQTDAHTIAGSGQWLTATAGVGTGMVPILDQAAGSHPVILSAYMGLQFAVISGSMSVDTGANFDTAMSIQWDEYRQTDG